MKIPILYKAVMDKVYERSYNGEIETGKLRMLLTYFFRIPRQLIQGIYRELQEYDLIEFKNHRIVIIHWRRKK